MITPRFGAAPAHRHVLVRNLKESDIPKIIGFLSPSGNEINAFSPDAAIGYDIDITKPVRRNSRGHMEYATIWFDVRRAMRFPDVRIRLLINTGPRAYSVAKAGSIIAVLDDKL